LLRQLPRHLDVPTQVHPCHPILGLALGAAEDPRAEADREAEDLDVERFGYQEMAELMDKDQNSQQQQGVRKVLKDHGLETNRACPDLQRTLVASSAGSAWIRPKCLKTTNFHEKN